MYLEDISLYCYDNYKREKDFYLISACVEDLYRRCLPKANTGAIGKVVIEAVDVTQDEPQPEEDEDVLTVYTRFDFDALWQSKDEFSRKKRILDLMHNSLLKAATIFYWDKKPFQEAYNCALGKKLINEEYIGKPISSPNKKLKAQLFYSYSTKNIEIYINITNTDGELGEKILVEKMRSSDGELAFVDVLGKLKWLSNNQLQLVSRSGEWKRKFKING